MPPPNHNLFAITSENAAQVALVVTGALQSFLKPIQFIADRSHPYQTKRPEENEQLLALLPSFYSSCRSTASSVFSWLYQIVKASHLLAQSSLSPAAAASFFSFLCSFFTTVDQILRSVVVMEEVCPMQTLHQLVEEVSRRLTPALYNFLHQTQQLGGKDAEMRKLEKSIPELVFALERFDATLVQINNKTKGKINLTMFVQRGTARDFRIDIQKLSKRIEENEGNRDDEQYKVKRIQTEE